MSGDGDDGGGTWVVEVDESSFGNEVLASDVPVVLDCYADWCGPCRQLTPVLEEIAQGGKLKLAKLNTDNNPQLAQGLNVSSLPTVIGVHNGKMVGGFTGNAPRADVDAFVEKLLAADE